MRPDGPRDTVVGPDDGPAPPFPIRLDGEVVKGFGRGSKELGIPTANIPLTGLTVGGHSDIESGVYYGWAGLSPNAATGQHGTSSSTGPTTKEKVSHAGHKVVDAIGIAVGGSTGEEEERVSTLAQDEGAVFPMVMSIGWNPFYKNSVRSVEVHLLHHFTQDFYGSHMNLVILGFIRPEYDYVSKESLIEDIKTDIEVTGRCLARPAYAKYRDDKCLLEFEGKAKEAN